MLGVQLAPENLHTPRFYDADSDGTAHALHLGACVDILVRQIHSGPNALSLGQIRYDGESHHRNTFFNPHPGSLSPHVHYNVFVWRARCSGCFLLLPVQKEPLQIHPIPGEKQTRATQITGS